MPYRDSAETEDEDNSSYGPGGEDACDWWRAKELDKEPHEILDTLVKQIADDQEARYAAYREYARVYGTDPDVYGSDQRFDLLYQQLNQNELANTIQTLHAQLFKDKLAPGVSANEADYTEWTRARGFSRWLEGVFDDSKIYYDALPRAGLDMLVFGTGAVKISHDEDADGVCSLRYHRTSPRYLYTDRLESKNGKPRNLYQKDFVDKYSLLAEYGKKDKGLYGSVSSRRAGILSCKPHDDEDMTIGSTLQTNMLVVYEAWHLPTRKGAKDGRHVIWVKGCTLVDEVWTWDSFPFAFMRYGGYNLSGFWGDSCVRILAPTQNQHDKLNAKIDTAQDIMGVPRIVKWNNAEVTLEHIDDIPGGIINVNGQPGSLTEWNAISVAPELYSERAGCPDKMRSLLGITSFDTSNQLPAQLREVSGPALERLISSGTARHAMNHNVVQGAIVELAYMAAKYAEDLQEDGKEITVAAKGEAKTSIEMLDFSKVNVDRARMKIEVQPMSQLPQTFALKVEHFGKLFEQKIIDAKTYLKMLEVPDQNGQTDIFGSDQEIIMKNLDFMVKKGKYVPPLQYDNLDLIVKMTTDFINWYRRREDCDMDTVGMLGQYIEDAITLKSGLGSKDAAAPVMPPAAAGAMPPGAPGLPPGAPPQGAPPVPGAGPGIPAGMPAPGPAGPQAGF